MSYADDFVQAVRRHRLVAILRGVPQDSVVPLAEALYGAGIRLVEVALSDPQTLPLVKDLASWAPSDAMVGAGTVTSSALAEAAAGEGAQFLVTPHVALPVIDIARQTSLGLLCGALTPTEIASAREAGAQLIKLFPASAVGPGYVKALLGPYPDLEVLVVGGISSQNLSTYLEAGALGAGVGGALSKVAAGDSSFAAARKEAARLVASTGQVKRG